ncbi:MAG: glycosyltransferase [Ignavibacteria bacterium]
MDIKKNSNNKSPFVSVIVAGRNEEHNIGRCINSLSKLTYPAGLMEIILVNDNSTDKTFDIMTELTKDIKTFKVINSRKSNAGNLKAKANAIDTAIEHCKGDIIISTDADCEVPPDWVGETVRYYKDKTGMVCGFTKIKSVNTLFDKMQNLDWMYLLTLASSSSGLKMILSCLGNNLSFSKEAYEKVGGYKSISFSVTEDLALMRNINSRSGLEVLYPVDKGCLVETLPCKDLSELFSQKRRWFRGGTGINFLGYIVGFELYILSIMLVSGLLFLNYKIYLCLILIKIISEIMLLSFTLKKLDLLTLLKYYPLFILYFAFYGLILPWSFLFSRKIRWKGKEY